MAKYAASGLRPRDRRRSPPVVFPPSFPSRTTAHVSLVVPSREKRQCTLSAKPRSLSPPNVMSVYRVSLPGFLPPRACPSSRPTDSDLPCQKVCNGRPDLKERDPGRCPRIFPLGTFLAARGISDGAGDSIDLTPSAPRRRPRRSFAGASREILLCLAGSPGTSERQYYAVYVPRIFLCSRLRGTDAKVPPSVRSDVRARGAGAGPARGGGGSQR